MKKLPVVLITSLLAATSLVRAETVIFDEGFAGSTVMSTNPAAPTATSTDYAVMSSKNASGSSLLNLNLSSGTSAGFGEIQALFTTNPVTLGVNEWISLEMTFKGTYLLDKDDGATQTLNVGLYNSGGSYPVPGGQMANAGMGSGTSFVSGYAQNWEGYMGRIGNLNGGNSSQILTRESQTDTTDENQDVLFNNSGTGAYDNPTGQGVASGANINLTDATDYTLVLTVLNDGSNIQVSQEIFVGVGTLGVSVYSASGTAPSGYEYDTFDSLAFGARFSAPGAPSIDVSKLSVTKYTIADLPALYNIQLNGFEANTYSGAAYIGSSGDVWNNPQWTGVDPGVSTNLFTGLTVLDSTGTDLGVTASLVALQNANSGGWNTGPFNRYSGKTAGSATAGLMDLEVKSDWHGSVNPLTLTLNGLPPNKLVTAYVYGSGDGSGQGSTWTMDAANGGETTTIDYDGSGTGRDVTLASSQGTGWEVISGSTDGSGDLTIVMSEGQGSVWYQTYLNGIQIQVGGVAPVITGLTNQTVETGSTVVLSPAVTGNPAPTYQWQENGTNLVGETNPGLTLTGVTTNQNGNVYSLIANNALGTVTNSMTLTVFAAVYSDMAVTALSPINGATDICVDTPLTVTFDDSISLGTLGSINIYDASNPGVPVDTIDAVDGETQQRNFPGDGQSFTYPTFTISGNTVTINPNFNVLDADTTYYVTLDPKTFLDSGGTNFVGLTDTNAWQFTTKSDPADSNNLVVNGDGSADFLTVQGAVNWIPGGNTTPRTVHVADGLYEEIVNIAGKHNITLRGESRTGTLVGFANNATYQAANGGTTHARMSFKVNADDIAIESLTLTNMTAQGGGQAEALMVETGAERCIVYNVDLFSRQDTILVNWIDSQVYFHQSAVYGNFDYIWGGGNVYFDDCDIHTVSGSGSYNVTAARTPDNVSSNATYQWLNPGGTYTRNGMSFVDCSFTADGGVTGVTLAGGNGTAANLVSWYGCDFSSAYVSPDVEFGGNYLWWQANNTQGGSPVTFANVTTHAVSDPEMVEATDPVKWLYGWSPELLPSILSQPVDQSVDSGDPASFSVSATGIPAPTYQWKHGGTNLVGETNATLNIASAQAADDGEYTVEVSNAAGTVVSEIATLTVALPTAPIMGDVMVLSNGVFQFSASGGSNEAFSVWATENLTNAPVMNTWTLLSNGVFGGLPEVITDGDATNYLQRFYLITTP